MCLSGPSQGMEKVCCALPDQVNEGKSPFCVVFFTGFFLVKGVILIYTEEILYFFFRVLFLRCFGNVSDLFIKEDF